MADDVCPCCDFDRMAPHGADCAFMAELAAREAATNETETER